MSGLLDRHLIAFTCLLHPVADIAMPSKRQAYKADFPITFDASAPKGSKQHQITLAFTSHNVPIEPGWDSESPILLFWQDGRRPVPNVIGIKLLSGSVI